MTSIERTAYPRLKRQFTVKELTEIYTPSQAEIAFAYATTQGESNILNLIVLLKTFERLGYFSKLSDIPPQIINHVRSQLKFSEEIVFGYKNLKTMYRHRTAIRSYLQVQNFNQTALHLAIESVETSAEVMDNPADLMNVAIAELIGGFGIVAKNDPIEQEKAIKYKDLVANAVVFQNVVDLTDILLSLQKEGYLINREDVAMLSPYITAHIKRFGDYLIDMETVPKSLDEVEGWVLV